MKDDIKKANTKGGFYASSRQELILGGLRVLTNKSIPDDVLLVSEATAKRLVKHIKPVGNTKIEVVNG